MKNIFKVMGVALLACSMIMVSCKKDENSDNGGSTVADGINVTFDGTSWVGTVNNSASYGTALQFSGKTAENYPMYDEVIMTVEPGTSTATADPNNQGSLGGDYAWVEYYQRTTLTNQNQTNYYGDWWGDQVNTEITAVDLTALTASAKMNGTMFDAAEAFVDSYGAVGIAAASRANYSATFGNVSLVNKATDTK